VLKGVQRIGEYPVARGSFGEVWKGTYEGKLIAVKVLHVYEKSDLVRLLKKFTGEAVIWKQLRHDNILPFQGVYHLDDSRSRACLVSPWMENGNIRQFLGRHPEQHCVSLVVDIAQGLAYLHDMKPCVIHGDLKGVNILITPECRACLADFGLSTARDFQASSKGVVSTAMSSGGTLRWMAPELIDVQSDPEGHGHISPASDVYAFACVCYEIFANDIPFHEIEQDWAVVPSVVRGERPSRPIGTLSEIRGLDDRLWGLISVCWASCPMGRMTAAQIVKFISGHL